MVADSVHGPSKEGEDGATANTERVGWHATPWQSSPSSCASWSCTGSWYVSLLNGNHQWCRNLQRLTGPFFPHLWCSSTFGHCWVWNWHQICIHSCCYISKCRKPIHYCACVHLEQSHFYGSPCSIIGLRLLLPAGCKSLHIRVWWWERTGHSTRRAKGKGQVCAHGVGQANELAHDPRGAIHKGWIIGERKQGTALSFSLSLSLYVQLGISFWSIMLQLATCLGFAYICFACAEMLGHFW